MKYDTKICKIISAKYQIAISKIPKYIVDFFYSKNWTYRITPYPYKKNDEYHCNIIGATSKNNKEIIQVSWYGCPIKLSNLTDTTYHEFGHFIQYFTEVDASNIMHQEMDKLSTITGNYCKTDPDEYFAEAFSIYIKNPDMLNNTCPKSYNLIEKTLIIFRNRI